MNILIYFPYNQRTVEQQSVIEMLIKTGHKVFLLTLSPEGYLHVYVRKLGAYATSSPVKNTGGIVNIIRNGKFLATFCKKNTIEIIIAHQQVAALPMIIASPFIKARKFYVRHNSDEDYLKHPFKARIVNQFINMMLSNIIAPSAMVYRYMIEKEKVSSRKITRINYGYNFSQYEKINEQTARDIRDRYACSFLIVSIARLVDSKRHRLMFEVIKSLRDNGKDVKMICLGDGYLKPELQEWLSNNGMDKHIILAGIQSNIFDYLSAADLLLHLSETEASNSVVKEAGLVNKSVIVCNNVGDFGDYIIDKKNGFLVNKKNPLEETIAILNEYYTDKNSLQQIGRNLHQTIVQNFDIGSVTLLYNDLLRPVY